MPAAIRSEDVLHVLFAVTQPEQKDGGHYMGSREWELGGREGHTHELALGGSLLAASLFAAVPAVGRQRYFVHQRKVRHR